MSTSWRTHPLPKDWKATRHRILQRDGYVCYICRKPGASEVDHVIPAVRGGTDADPNLRAVCEPCHRAKTVRESHGASRRRQTEQHPGEVA